MKGFGMRNLFKVWVKTGPGWIAKSILVKAERGRIAKLILVKSLARLGWIAKKPGQTERKILPDA